MICIIEDAVRCSSLYWGEHGSAFLIEEEGRRVLFDTGQCGTVFLNNLALLGVDPQAVDTLAFSHGHYGRTGGLPALAERLRPGTATYVNPDLQRKPLP